MFQASGILEVVRTSGGALVSQEIVQAEQEKVLTAVSQDNAMTMRALEINSVDRGQNVDAIRRTTKLNGISMPGKILRCEPTAAKAKFANYFFHAPGVVGICRHPDVQVGREAWMAVEDHGVAADNEILNVV